MESIMRAGGCLGDHRSVIRALTAKVSSLVPLVSFLNVLCWRHAGKFVGVKKSSFKGRPKQD